VTYKTSKRKRSAEDDIGMLHIFFSHKRFTAIRESFTAFGKKFPAIEKSFTAIGEKFPAIAVQLGKVSLQLVKGLLKFGKDLL